MKKLLLLCIISVFSYPLIGQMTIISYASDSVYLRDKIALQIESENNEKRIEIVQSILADGQTQITLMSGYEFKCSNTDLLYIGGVPFLRCFFNAEKGIKKVDFDMTQVKEIARARPD